MFFCIFYKIQENLEQLWSSQIIPRAKQLLDVYTNVTYELGEEDFLQNTEITESFVQNYFSGLEALLKQYEVRLNKFLFSNMQANFERHKLHETYRISCYLHLRKAGTNSNAKALYCCMYEPLLYLTIQSWEACSLTKTFVTLAQDFHV